MKGLTCRRVTVTLPIMRCQTRHARFRTLVGSVGAFLFVAQLALVQIAQTRNAPSALSDDVQIASALTMGVICHSDDGGKPSKSNNPSCAHCALCANGARDAIVLIAPLRIVISLAVEPASTEAPGWSIEAPPGPKPQGWTSSWSSRAPPFFS